MGLWGLDGWGLAKPPEQGLVRGEKPRSWWSVPGRTASSPRTPWDTSWASPAAGTSQVILGRPLPSQMSGGGALHWRLRPAMFI